MGTRAHLATLLSQVLVAYTIEADYEFEAAMPHRTAQSGAAGQPARGPWLISLAMWANFLKYVTEDGISVAELSARSGIRKPETAGMVRWGYVSLDGDRLRLTSSGARASGEWARLEDRIESRWSDRFGAAAVDAVRSSIAAAIADIRDVGPDYLPIVRHGLGTSPALRPDRDPADQGISFSATLSRALTVIAVAFERTSPVSIALAANVLRVLEHRGTPVREVAALAGVAREITQVSLGYLDRQGLIRVTSSDRGKLATPTDAGLAVRELAEQRLTELDARFEPTRAALEGILSQSDALVDGLTPHPEAWRARSPYAAQTRLMLEDPRSALPHFPIVTHRGGYPDGS